MKRYITLGNGQRCSLGVYVSAWKLIKAQPDQTWLCMTPSGWPGTCEDALYEFRSGIHDRINRHTPGYGKGRKWTYEWQIETIRAANDLNTPRLVVRWLPPELRERFKHRVEPGWNPHRKEVNR